MEHEEFKKLYTAVEQKFAGKYWLIPRDLVMFAVGACTLFLALTVGTSRLATKAAEPGTATAAATKQIEDLKDPSGRQNAKASKDLGTTNRQELIDKHIQPQTRPQRLTSPIPATGLPAAGTEFIGSRLNIGADHTISPEFSSIAGGEENEISGGDDSFIGAGTENLISSGAYSFIGAGSENLISIEEGSFIGAGYDNRILDQGLYSVIGGGLYNTITAKGSVIGGGWLNEIGVYYSVVGGGYKNTNNSLVGAIGGGYWNHITGPLATIPGGTYASAPLYGQLTHSSGGFVLGGGGLGQAQSSEFIARNGTSSTNETELFLNGYGATMDPYAMSGQRMIIPTNAAWAFDIMVIARNANGDCGAFRTNGVIKNVSGNVSLVGVPSGETTVPPLARDISTWTVKVSADNVNKALAVFVSGASSTNRWVATIQATELIH